MSRGARCARRRRTLEEGSETDAVRSSRSRRGASASANLAHLTHLAHLAHLARQRSTSAALRRPAPHTDEAAGAGGWASTSPDRVGSGRAGPGRVFPEPAKPVRRACPGVARRRRRTGLPSSRGRRMLAAAGGLALLGARTASGLAEWRPAGRA
jgi:hypothetical protein